MQSHKLQTGNVCSENPITFFPKLGSSSSKTQVLGQGAQIISDLIGIG